MTYRQQTVLLAPGPVETLEQPKNLVLIGSILTLVGVALLGTALFGSAIMMTVRIVLALVALVFLFKGLGKLGTSKWGSQFDLSYWLACIWLVALILAAIAGLVCTLTTRSGLAVAAVIIVLMVTSGIVTSALSITYQSEHPARGQIPASFNPFTAVAELVAGLFDQPTPNPTIPRPTGVGVPAAAAVCAVWVVAPTLLLIQRMRKAASL